MNMYAAILSITFLTYICVITANITIPQNNAKNLECFGTISNLLKRQHIFYKSTEENVDDILIILHKNENLLSLFDFKKNAIYFEEITYYDVFIIEVKCVDDFLNFIENIRHTVNSKGKFLILYYGNEGNVEEVLKTAWKYYLVDINVVTMTNNKIISYFPYGNNDCHEIIDAYFKSCIEIEGMNSLEGLFPNKVPHDLKGCDTKFGVLMQKPFTIDARSTKLDAKVVGLEVVLLRTILEWVNSKETLTFGIYHRSVHNKKLSYPLKFIFFKSPAKFFFKVSEYEGLGIRYPNGTIVGTLSKLIPHETDIIFGHLWPNTSFLPETDMMYPFYINYVRWYVPRALQLAKWKCLFVILQAKLWALIFAIFIINAFVWWIIAKQTKDIKPLQKIGQCLLYGFYVLCLGASPLPNKFIMRLLVLNWTLGTLILAVVYQSQLLTILTSPIYEHQITELEELPGSNLRFIAAAVTIPTLQTLPKDILDWIMKNGEFLDLDIMMQKQMQFDGTFLFVSNYYWMKFVAELYYTNADGSSKVYNLYHEEYTSLNVPICSYTTKGYPFFERFNEIGFRLHAAGFLEKWLKDVDTTFTGKIGKDPIRLTLDHVAGGFYLLACGLLVSFVVFVVEILVHKFRSKRIMFIN